MSTLGQNIFPKVKKRIEIIKTYDYNLHKDGKIYILRKGKIKLDTISQLYNPEGKRKNIQDSFLLKIKMDTTNTWESYEKKIIEYSYNREKKEKFISRKTKLKRRKTIIWDTFYHSYHKQYFTKKSITKYNKYMLPIKKVNYDLHLKHIDSESIYIYEFF